MRYNGPLNFNFSQQLETLVGQAHFVLFFEQGITSVNSEILNVSGNEDNFLLESTLACGTMELLKRRMAQEALNLRGKLWNHLPEHMKSAENLYIFKKLRECKQIVLDTVF